MTPSLTFWLGYEGEVWETLNAVSDRMLREVGRSAVLVLEDGWLRPAPRPDQRTVLRPALRPGLRQIPRSAGSAPGEERGPAASCAAWALL